jgi:putative nucleotide binding protein
MSDREKKNYSRDRRGNNRDSQGGSRRRSSGSGRSRPRLFIRSGTVLYLLDILQHGGVDKVGHSWRPICQVLDTTNFQLYEMSLNKQKISELKLQQKITYSGREGSVLERLNKRLKYDDLTPTSNQTLSLVIEQYVVENESRFIKFINNVGPITIKRHYLEVLPGVGKKLMNELLQNRHKKLFDNFDELHKRVPGFKPKDVFTKRILDELQDQDLKHYIFVKHLKPDNRRGDDRQRRTSRDGGRRSSQGGGRRTTRNDSRRRSY